ncbi:NRF1-like protein [Mya arenaria]|uniref:NRF1-like protein n=1 Tax=Mya arenaria TaxID=6604 RepID=A0ABY7G1V0_MYAAR|nr:NRF1-like protein [Mya arenaria]
MVLGKTTDEGVNTELPPLTLQCMTQNQLENLIPKLVAKVTGRKTPKFGAVQYKPSWWPSSLEWTNPETLSDLYQNPCEKLREIVRSCYCYMDQDGLLRRGDLSPLSVERPASPISQSSPTNKTFKGERKKAETGPDSDLNRHLNKGEEKFGDDSSEVMVIDLSDNESDAFDNEKVTAGTSKDMAIEALTVGKNKPDGGSGKAKNLSVEELINEISKEGGEASVIDKAEDITPDLIAQIDLEIAKSIKQALGLVDSNQTSKTAGGANGNNNQSGKGKRPNILNRIPRWKEKNEEKTNARKFTWKTETGSANKVIKPEATSYDSDPESLTKAAMEKIKELDELIMKIKPASREDKHEDEVVWICFICAKSFPDQSELMAHQDICEEGETSDTQCPILTPGPRVSLTDSTDQGVQPVPTLLRKVGSNIKSLPLGLPSRPRIVRRPKFVDIYIPPGRDVYFEALGLVQTPKVEEIIKSPRKSVTEDDCQIIDLTVDDEQTVPITPRSRSLMSQLSNEGGSARKRQLSFSQSSPVKNIASKMVNKLEEQSQSSESSDEDCRRLPVRKVLPKSTILGIPLTSPLGQRLKKHWSFDNKVPVVKDIEQYCKNNVVEDLAERERKKNPMVEKLRNRPPPQVTFKFTKRYMNKWSHMYKFNRVERREFEKSLRTGLGRESRLRLKRMKACKVVIRRISKKDIKYWTTPRPKIHQARAMLSQFIRQKPNACQRPQIRQRNTNQYRLPAQQKTVFSSTNFQTFHPHQTSLLNPRGLRPQLLGIQPSASIPTPQLLVRSIQGGQGMQLQVLEVQSSQLLGQNVFSSPPKHSQKRKQVFNNIREDDMVICLSSDDEDKSENPIQSACEMGKQLKNLCDMHEKRKIGPASFMKSQRERKERARSRSMSVSEAESPVVNQTEFNPTGLIIAGATSLRGPSPFDGSTHVRINNGQMTVLNSQPEGSSDNPDEIIAKGEHLEDDKSNVVKIQPADEFMDFEVICIDSDGGD